VRVCLYVCPLQTITFWHVCADVFEHLRLQLASRCPLWSDITSVDTITQWREDWLSHDVDDDAVIWLESTVTAALIK